MVTKFSDINEKILPFFVKYPVHGVKNLEDYFPEGNPSGFPEGNPSGI